MSTELLLSRWNLILHVMIFLCSGQLEAFHHTSPTDVPGNYIPSKKIGIQLSKSSSYQPAVAGYFPQRLGLQLNDVATTQSVRGQLHVSQNLSYLIDFVFVRLWVLDEDLRLTQFDLFNITKSIFFKDKRGKREL